MKRTLLFLLIAALLLPCILASCNEKDPPITPPEQTSTETTTPPDTTTPPADDTPLYEGPALTEDNALKCVRIYTGASESEIYAGEELAEYLQKKGVYVQENGFPVTISMDATLGDDAFKITATLDGENAGMAIVGGNGRGVLYGVYKFLEELGGVRYFMPGLEKVPEDAIVLTEGEILSYTPFFEDRRLNWNAVRTDADWCTKQGINGHDGELSAKYGGKNVYGSGLFVHTLGALTETGDSVSPNPCLSLDSPEGQANYQNVLKNLRVKLEADPTINIVSVSQNDKNEYCKCEYCLASYARYTNNPSNVESGGTAGNLLEFVNAVAEELADEYPDLVVDTLAYNYTQAPPKGIVPRENVCIRVCSIRVCFMHPMTECPDSKGPNGIQWTRTALFRTDFVNWGKICDRIYVWDYTTNFAYYIAPFSNFGSIRENMRYYHEHGVRGMFPQGNSQSKSGEFGELRAYLLAKLMWNPYMSEEEYYTHMDEFLEAYYGAGWSYIRKYIDKITELADDGCINIYEAPLEAITAEEYLANEADFEDWWNKAEEATANYKELANVRRSRLQWRYIQLLIHPDAEKCAQFTTEVNLYGIRWAESGGNNKPIDKKFPELYPTN